MNHLDLIVGNLCSLLAMGSNAISSTRKTVKGVLAMQNVSQVIYCFSAIVLKGYSAAVQNAVSFFRNLTAIWNIRSKALEWVLIAAAAVLGVAFNNRGLLGLLPVVGNLQYTLAIFRFKGKERLLKISFLLSLVAFVIFNFAIGNYVGVICDSVVIVTTIVVLIRDRKK
jgi:hypothetical protein